MPGKIRPWLVSLLCGSTLLSFWAYLDQAARAQFAAPLPAKTVAASGQVARPVVPAGYFDDDDGEREDEWNDDDDDRARTLRPVQDFQSQLPADTAAPVPTAPTATSGNYRDGAYTASSGSPWGLMTIEVTVAGGKWTDIKNLAIPDSPPSYYAVTYLVQQALAAQGAQIDGVSGATYTSDAFRDDLAQIVALSQK